MKEISGVAKVARPSTIYTCDVIIAEGSSTVILRTVEVELTPEEARHIAACLLRAARRVEKKPVSP